MIIKKKKYFGWNKYGMLVSEIDHLRFMDNTAKESIRNMDDNYFFV